MSHVMRISCSQEFIREYQAHFHWDMTLLHKISFLLHLSWSSVSVKELIGLNCISSVPIDVNSTWQWSLVL
jgi:hypothetical protein